MQKRKTAHSTEARACGLVPRCTEHAIPTPWWDAGKIWASKLCTSPARDMKNTSAERARRTDKFGNAVRRPSLTRESMMRPARGRWPASLCEWAHCPPTLSMSWPDGQPRAHRECRPRPWTDLKGGSLADQTLPWSGASYTLTEPHAPCTEAPERASKPRPQRRQAPLTTDAAVGGAGRWRARVARWSFWVACAVVQERTR
jgi:hypothetical protein